MVVYPRGLTYDRLAIHMSRIKILIVLVIIIGGAFAGVNYLNQQLAAGGSGNNSQVQPVTSNGITYYMPADEKFIVARFHKPLEYKFTAKNAQNLKEQSYIENYLLSFNASYYRGSYVNAEHAGLLQLKGDLIEDLVLDKQLTHIVVYDHQTDRFKFLPAANFDQEAYITEDYTLFQTGPLVLENNQVQIDLIDNSTNGTGKYLRTLLGYTDKGDTFVVATKVNFTLTDIANELLKLELFKGEKLTLVNLDGGASTAIYSKDHTKFSFGESKRLPLIIGVR